MKSFRVTRRWAFGTANQQSGINVIAEDPEDAATEVARHNAPAHVLPGHIHKDTYWVDEYSENKAGPTTWEVTVSFALSVTAATAELAP